MQANYDFLLKSGKTVFENFVEINNFAVGVIDNLNTAGTYTIRCAPVGQYRFAWGRLVALSPRPAGGYIGLVRAERLPTAISTLQKCFFMEVVRKLKFPNNANIYRLVTMPKA
ncbi:MAG: hypothetical protein LBH43_08010 [Treponema sp.]|jgi:hypothetical protein|nr:hypothetical protein [Treponema sp.]